MISVPRNGASPAVGSVVWKTTNVMVSAVPSKTRASPPGGAQWTALSTRGQSQPAFTSLAGLTLPAEADGAARARTASTTAKIQRRFISSPPPTPPAVTAESIKLAEITRLITRWAHAFRGRMVRGSEANRHSASGPLGAPAACRPPWASFQTTFSAMSNCFLTRGYSGVRPKPRAGPLSGPRRHGRMRGPGFEWIHGRARPQHPPLTARPRIVDNSEDWLPFRVSTLPAVRAMVPQVQNPDSRATRFSNE